MRRHGSEVITRLTTIALLSALGFVLMAFCRFSYPFAPWLMIEISDLVVLIAYAAYGFTGSLTVAVLKTGLDLAIHGLTGIYGIGNITALLTSLLYVLMLFITSHVMKLFKKGIGFRILAYTLIVIVVSVVMTFLNYLFITPTYLTGAFTTCFNSESVQTVMDGFKSMGISQNAYPLAIIVVYLPFNLLKGIIITAIYEILFNRLIFVILQRSPKMKKYFLGSIFKKEEKEEDNSKENNEKQS